jgi:hypothetical protein
MIAGSGGQLVLSDADRGSLVLEGCQITGWKVDVRNHSAPWMTADGACGRAVMRRELSGSIDFIATGQQQLEFTPRDLQLADDMTVRELLGAVHRKLKER